MDQTIERFLLALRPLLGGNFLLYEPNEKLNGAIDGIVYICLEPNREAELDYLKFLNTVFSAEATAELKKAGLMFKKASFRPSDLQKLKAHPFMLRAIFNSGNNDKKIAIVTRQHDPTVKKEIGAIFGKLEEEQHFKLLAISNESDKMNGASNVKNVKMPNKKLNENGFALFVFYTIKNINELSMKMIKWKKPSKRTKKAALRRGKEGMPTWMPKFKQMIEQFFGLIFIDSRYRETFKKLEIFPAIYCLRSDSARKLKLKPNYAFLEQLPGKEEDVVSELFTRLLATIKYAHKKMSQLFNQKFLDLIGAQKCIDEYPLLSAAEARFVEESAKLMEYKQNVTESTRDFWSGEALDDLYDF